MLTVLQSEDEEEAAERERQEAEKAKALGPSSQLDPSKATAPPSGATTPIARRERGPGTPSDREGKQKRKRPGSPYLSEAGSGTDTSTRNKKPKTNHDGLPRSDSKLKIRGPGSDTDDAARRLKKRHHKTSTNPPSRAGSPPAPSQPINLDEVAPPEKMRETVIAHPEGLTMAEFLAKIGLGRYSDKVVLGKHIGPHIRLVTREDGKKVVSLKNGPLAPASAT